MANVELKKNFKDGQYLYGDDLNNNFKVIEAGINANEDNLQGVIDQAQEELRNELEEITGERGWDWNDGSAERVTFYKGNTEQVNAKEVSNGQLLYDTTTGETALDTGGKRVMTGAGNILAVSEEEPTNPGTKVWINPDKIVKQPASNVVDSLEGNETDKSPSVKAVKEGIKEVYSTEEQVIGTWMGKPLYRKGFYGTTHENYLSTFLTSAGNIKRIVCTKGYINYYDGTGEVPNVIDVEIGKSISNIEEASRVLVVDSNLRLDCGSSLYGKPFEVSVEYTKTTD